MLSWLIAFNVINTRNQFVAMVGDFLYRITEPVLRPIRNMLPSLGGIDISPVIVIFIISFCSYVIRCTSFRTSIDPQCACGVRGPSSPAASPSW